MSAAAQSRIFGIKVGIDPKILAAGLLAIAVGLFWFNSRGDETGGAIVHPRSSAVSPVVTPRRTPVARRQQAVNSHETLRLRPIDATRGDIDPTLRLDLLARVRSVPLETSMRNVFEEGAAPMSPEQIKALHAPKIVPAALPPTQTQAPGPAAITANIPLKYYGFAQPAAHGQQNRGFFLEGDNVIVAIEGEVLDGRYLVVELTPQSARLEDTQLKQGQSLPVMAEAVAP